MITRRMVDITALLLVKVGVTRGGQRLVDGLITALGSLVSTGRDLHNARFTKPLRRPGQAIFKACIPILAGMTSMRLASAEPS